MFNRIIRGINRNRSKYLFLSLVLILLSSLSIVSLNYSKFAKAEQERLLTEHDNKIYLTSGTDNRVDKTGYLDEEFYQELLASNKFETVRLVSDYDVILNDAESYTPDSYITRVAKLELTNVNPLDIHDTSEFVIISSALASVNDLSVGSVIQIDFDRQNYDLVVTDIIDQEKGKENLIITNSFDLHQGSFERAELTLKNQDDLADIYGESGTIGCQIYLGDISEQGRILVAINNISEKIIELLVFFSIILVAFMVLFIVKDRRKEIGIYLSLGSSKLKIFTLIMSEVFFVTILAVTASLALTYFLSEYLAYVTSHIEVISEAVSELQNINIAVLGKANISGENFVFSPSIKEIFTTYALVLAVVLISATTSLISIIKYDERDILHV